MSWVEGVGNKWEREGGEKGEKKAIEKRRTPKC